jgi:type III secretion protein L
VAEKIIGTDLQRDPEVLLRICATAIETVRNARELVLRVNPADAALLRAKKAELLDLIGRMKDLAVKEDPAVRAGGCVIETDAGTIDAQLHIQLEMLEAVLLPDPAKKATE